MAATAGAQVDFDRDALAAYLRAVLPEAAGPLTLEAISGGQSNPTYRLRLGAQRLILRKQPGGELLPSAHAVDREFRVQQALATSDVPVPAMLHLCADRSVIGTLFYVMAEVPGRVIDDSALPGCTPAERGAIYDAMNDTLARLHRVDWQALGLGDFGKPGNYFARQVARWTRQWQASKTRDVPAIDKLGEWLAAHLPEDDGATTIVHGDYRLGNLLLHPEEPRVVAILDWELSTLGHPLADLAFNCLLYHAGPTEHRGVRGLDLAALGIPAQDAYVRRYGERTGRGGLTEFHLAFAMFRFAAIFEGIAKRALQGNAASADAAATGRLGEVYGRRGCELLGL